MYQRVCTNYEFLMNSFFIFDSILGIVTCYPLPIYVFVNSISLDYTGQQNFFGIYGETVSGVYRGR